MAWSIITMHPGIGSGASFKDWASFLARLKNRPTGMAVEHGVNGVGAVSRRSDPSQGLQA